MKGYFRRRSITALTSFGVHDRCRTRCGRVDFGARARRLIPSCPSAPPSLQPADRSRSYAFSVRYRSAATAGTCSSTLKLRYDRIRMDSMFMVRVSLPSGLAFTGGYPIRHRRGLPRVRCRTRRLPSPECQMCLS